MVEQAANVCCGVSGGHPGLRHARGPEPDQLRRHRRPGLRRLPLFQCLRGRGPPGGRPAGPRAGRRRVGAALDGTAPTGSGTRASSESSPTSRPDEPGTDRSGIGPLPRRPGGSPSSEALWTDDPDLPDRSLRDAGHQHAGPGRPLRPVARLRPPVGADRRDDPAAQSRAQGRSATCCARTTYEPDAGRTVVRAISTRSPAWRPSGWSGS